MKTQIERYHDISVGHRVVGHENKCRHLHGHNYRVHFTCELEDGYTLDQVGRVIDFSDVKERLCMWLESHWDHKFLVWNQDPVFCDIIHFMDTGNDSLNILVDSIVWLDFNPTAENLARYLVEVIGPIQLLGTHVKLVKVKIEETSKCSASFEI